MRPILLQWRGLRVWSYPAMLYAGLVAGVVAGQTAVHAAGIDAFRTYLATLLLIVPALIGARLLFVLAHWRFYRQNLRRIWDRGAGGASMYGGLPVAIPLSVPLLAALQLPFGAFWDVATFTILVGMIFTRAGCLLNGCCAGRFTTTWLGIHLPNHLGVWEKRIPTQCLEAGWAAILLGTAIVVWPRLPFPGALLPIVATGYAFGRLPLESMREVEPGGNRITIDHVISTVVIVVSLAILAVRWPT